MENYYLGIDLGGTTTKFGLVTTEGRLKKNGGFRQTVVRTEHGSFLTVWQVFKKSWHQN